MFGNDLVNSQSCMKFLTPDNTVREHGNVLPVIVLISVLVVFNLDSYNINFNTLKVQIDGQVRSCMVNVHEFTMTCLITDKVVFKSSSLNALPCSNARKHLKVV